MATVYYKGFSVAKVGTNGHRVDMPAEDIDAYNVTASASLGTLTTNEFAMIEEGSFTATAGDIVEFSHATLPNTFRMYLSATQDAAYTDPRNSLMTFILEDLFADTTDSTGDLYAYDLDNTEKGMIYLGSTMAGVTNEIPYQSTVDQPNLRLFLVTKDTTGKFSKGQLSAADLSNAEYADISIPGVLGTLGPSAPPATAGSTGTTGMATWDSSYFYICIATDTWKRVAISTW
jgi:hypothetical protein